MSSMQLPDVSLYSSDLGSIYVGKAMQLCVGCRLIYEGTL